MSDEELFARVEAIRPHLPGWCSGAKARKLVETILTFGPELCVEIGVFGGSSLLPQALAVAHLGRGRVVGIDPWSCDAALEGMSEEVNRAWWGTAVDLEAMYQECLRQLARLGLEGCRELLRCRSREAADRFAAGTIGLLHIDGNHSEAASCQDVELYLPRVAAEGYVFFDDVSWQEQSVGTTRKALTYLLRHGCERVDSVDDCAILRKMQ
jgi:predicted O-methyltransferase YrrM